ncbi:O-antigen ligase family protein [Aurantiacibacter sediminis]|uniref:O-antigen ligase family protein n=1 Tax=Aurantiacibacter sediminis TaxID=2793064 RepID=A0ABS0N3B2_9SPHN|nr:O-antigen ligase family protein [Aurantiacibacter sediminis]
MRASTPLSRLGTSKSRFAALVIFLLVVFFLGGGSRADIESLVILRPFCALALGYAAFFIQPGDLKEVRIPMLFLLGLAIIMAVQLIPLPPSVWQSLPSRDVIAATDELAGLGDISRPISLSPSKTWNALASLIVPAAALAMFAMQKQYGRSRMLPLLLAFAFISAVLSILQLAGPAGGPLYFYRITNATEAVGLFSNRNHNALFLAAAIVLAAHFALSNWLRGKSLNGQLALALALTLTFIVPLFLGASRMGVLAMVMMLLVAAALFYFVATKLNPEANQKRSRGTLTAKQKRWVVIGGIAALTLFAGSALFFSVASERFSGVDQLTELRIAVLPTLLEMSQRFAVSGSGFGSFEHVYKIFEPDELLAPTYLNHAHNDWLQIIIEGGIVSAGLFVALALWGAMQLRGMRSAVMQRDGTYVIQAAAAASFLILIVLGSAVDYPLRVPSLMAASMLALALLKPVPFDKRGPSQAR